ncbi:hypothetical protein U27_01427 [Candidatus Vecturithrix granuli]|uniref:Uncharacterized protein n=1 Tax=Vecturithrix granuli TaxID=1499967 RepID=A0A081CAC1_VECG1|nr:hypothetical protein U27_01427 [Candidatus Vecturithrix granuli]
MDQVKTLIKPWKGLKLTGSRWWKKLVSVCENPNKTLEGIKTYTFAASAFVRGAS